MRGGSSVWKRLRGAACGLAACTLALPSAVAEPALWAVKDADSTVYLFGTVHILRPELKWRSPRIDAAMAASDELWLEIAYLTSPLVQIMASIPLLQYGLSSEPLSSKLTPAELAALDRAARKVGMTAQSLDAFKPWLAASMLSAQEGYDAKAGAEFVIESEFKKKRAPLRGLETINEQFRMLASMPDGDALEFLRQAIDEEADGAVTLDSMVEKWVAGDVKGLEELVLPDLKTDSGAMYDILIVKRNADWAEQIEDLMKGSGVSFIAVGAGHLLGPDSVQSMLEKKGMRVTRQ
jgi:uncharacterized protein YbaP (TraB family)